MSLLSIIHGLRRLLRRSDVDAELQDEIAHYLEESARDHTRRGLSDAQAARAARVAFGGVEAAKEGVRSAGWDAVVETIRRDAVYGARSLARNPAFTLIAVLTLTLGIGANTAMFSVVNAVMLRPLPYRNAGRLALVWTDDTRRGLHEEGTAFLTIADWRRDNRSFQSMAFFSTTQQTLVNGTSRERTRSAFVSSNLFPTLGVATVAGRAISLDDEINTEPVAVINHSLAQRQFGGDSAAIGRIVQLEDAGKAGGGELTIVGVMPAGFYFPDKQTEIWTPATTYWRFRRESTERFPAWVRRWTAIGRLNDTASVDDAAADLARIGRHLSATYPTTLPDFPGLAANVVPVLDHVTGRNLQSALLLLLAAVGLVLLVACANVANLLLARGATRQREFAIRRALGAAKARLVRQLVVESLLLATAGGFSGLLLAVAGTRVLALSATAGVPRLEEVSVDGRVLAFAAVLSLSAGIVFGVLPAFRVSGVNAGEVLKQTSHLSGGVRLRTLRGILVVAECSLAVVLLAGAGLLLTSLSRLRSVDPGFDTRHVLTMRIELSPAAQRSESDATRATNADQLLVDLMARIEAVPGVEAAGYTDDLLITGQANESISIPGRAIDSLTVGELNAGDVSSSFFATMRVPLTRGRALTHDDAHIKIRALFSQPIGAVAEPVVVNEAFARRFFPAEDPIRKRFCIDPTSRPYWYEIVGVVGDMRRQSLERRAIPEYFGSYIPSPRRRVDLVVRARRDPLAVAPAVRRAVMEAFPSVLVEGASTAERELGELSAARSLQTWLLAAFAALALSLATVGIYGVVHYTVAERRREIGVRLALGASGPAVLGMVIRQGMLYPVVGVGVGGIGALAATRAMRHFLFDTSSRDPVTFLGVLVVLAASALIACYFPARSAAVLDPVETLRHE